MGIVDRHGEMIDCNAALTEMVGYSREELLALSFTDLTHPDDLEREWQLIRELWDEESTEYRMEKRYVHKDGHVIWVDVAASLYQDDEGDLAFGFAFVQDITARKRARETRQLNEQRMQALLELTQMREAPLSEIADFALAQAVKLTRSEMGFLGFIDADEEQMTLHAWSEKAMRGCEVNDKPRHFWLDEAGVWAEAVRQHRPFILNEYADPHPKKKGYPEGHVSLTRLLSVPISKGNGVEAVIAVANKEAVYDEADVRQLQLLLGGMLRLVRERRAAAELRESEKKFRTLVENVVDWVWQVDENGVYTYASPQVRAIMGYMASEVLGKTPFDFMMPEEAERVGAIFAETAAAQESIKGLEDTIIAKDGREILFETNAAPLFDADGELAGYMGTCRDITERKRAEEAVRASEARYRYIFRTAGVPIWEEDFSVVKAAIDALEVEDFRQYLESHPEFLTQAQQMIKIRDVNPATLKMLGAESKAEVQGALDKVFVPETQEILKDELIALAEGKTYFEGETINRTLQGERRNVLLTMAIPTGPEKLESILISTMDITERKRVEQELRRLRDFYSLVLANVHDGIWVTDEKDRVVYFNAAMEKITGIKAEDLLGADVFEDSPQRAVECFEEIYRRAKAEGRALPFENDLMTPTGRVIQAGWFVPSFEDGAYAGMICTIHDITERKLAEEALRESERQKNLILNSTAEMVAYYDTDLHIIWANRAAAESVGKTPEELVGAHCYEIWHGRQRPCVGCPILKARDDKESHQNEMQTPDGRYWLLRGYPILDENEEVMALVEFGQDITERKQAQETLREAELRYRTVADFTYDWELWESPDGTLRYVSPSCERVTGYSAEQFKRDPALIARIIVSEDKEVWEEHRRVIEETRSSNGTIQFRVRRRDGETIWLEHACRPVLDAEDRFLGWRVSNRDITERKEAQEQVAQYTIDLQRSNEELQQFAYVVSHDLQAPLRTIKGYLRLLAEDYDQRLDEHADLYIHQVLAGAERMQEMIMALLNLSRVETRGAPFAPTDCALLVEQVLEDLRSIIQEADADVRCNPLPTLPADRAQLARVFQNLIANAIKFRREDVTPRIHISAEREGEAWTFAVADNGIGLDPAHAERIFQIFQRLHTDEEYPGLGIGLALCKRIVERHDGRIWVESEPGAGSTFYFTLPAETETS